MPIHTISGSFPHPKKDPLLLMPGYSDHVNLASYSLRELNTKMRTCYDLPVLLPAGREEDVLEQEGLDGRDHSAGSPLLLHQGGRLIFTEHKTCSRKYR